MTTESLANTFLDSPGYRSNLGDAAKMMVTHLTTAPEKLETPEAQAFATWLHGAYLSIFTHIDDGHFTSSLLGRRIHRMLDQGETVLTTSTLSNIAYVAKRAIADFQPAATMPKLDSRELFSLAARLPLGPITKQLLAWVDLAYGDQPKAYSDISYFAIRANGSLYQNGMPSASVKEEFLTPAWRQLPAFWRIIYIISHDASPYHGSAQHVLSEVISVSALPLPQYPSRGIPFTNYIALIRQLDFLFGPELHTERNATLVYRLLQPWDGKVIIGARYAEDWLAWMAKACLGERTLHEASIYRFIGRRSVQNKLDPIVFASLEAVDPNAQPEDATDTPDKDEANTDADTNDATDTTNPPKPATTPPAAASPTNEDPNATGDTSTDPQPDQNNNSIGDISLKQDDDPGRAYLYRRGVMSLNDTLARDQNIGVSQDVRQTLHLWCRDWLWLASVDQTEALIEDLGLQEALGPIAKKD